MSTYSPESRDLYVGYLEDIVLPLWAQDLIFLFFLYLSIDHYLCLSIYFDVYVLERCPPFSYLFFWFVFVDDDGKWMVSCLAVQLSLCCWSSDVPKRNTLRFFYS